MPKIEDRFWAKVNKTENCWEWIGAISSTGYGNFAIHHGEFDRAHRIAWKLVNGEIPKGIQICHKCDNRKCVRPNHLFMGTMKDNMQDASKKGRMSRGENRWNSKLVASDIEKIKILHWINGLSYSRIGQLFGVSPAALCRVVKGKTWKHVLR